MPLIKSSGNMYPWISHLWNPVKGECPYRCSYCYVSRITDRYGKKQNPLHPDERDLRTKLGTGNFIFVCSGCDLFHPDVPEDWIANVRNNTFQYPGNRYLWHTKNPGRVIDCQRWFNSLYAKMDVLCVTVESDIPRPAISKAPQPMERIEALKQWKGPLMITIEPIMDFDVTIFSEMILSCEPEQVNIGADSGNNNLPEPSPEKIGALIEALRPFTKVYLKKNLHRLLPEHELYEI
jgi:protein gp37